MTSRTRRSPEQIIADLNAKLAKAQAKAAISQSKADSRLVPIVEQIEALDKAEANVRKGLTTGPQSFESRRKSHELWLLEITAAENLAKVQLGAIQEQKAHFKAALSLLGQAIADQQDAATIADLVSTSMNSIPKCANLGTYQEAFSNAQNARKAFTQAKATNKPESAVETIAEAQG